jgi:hypothetical protein
MLGEVVSPSWFPGSEKVTPLTECCTGESAGSKFLRGKEVIGACFLDDKKNWTALPPYNSNDGYI